MELTFLLVGIAIVFNFIFCGIYLVREGDLSLGSMSSVAYNKELVAYLCRIVSILAILYSFFYIKIGNFSFFNIFFVLGLIASANLYLLSSTFSKEYNLIHKISAFLFFSSMSLMPVAASYNFILEDENKFWSYSFITVFLVFLSSTIFRYFYNKRFNGLFQLFILSLNSFWVISLPILFLI